MNTKYPINGRVATLNDLVHEYGAYSSWPQTSDYDLFDTKNQCLSLFRIQYLKMLQMLIINSLVKDHMKLFILIMYIQIQKEILLVNI